MAYKILSHSLSMFIYETLSLYKYIYIYIYMCVCVCVCECVCIYIYIYIRMHPKRTKKNVKHVSINQNTCIYGRGERTWDKGGGHTQNQEDSHHIYIYIYIYVYILMYV